MPEPEATQQLAEPQTPQPVEGMPVGSTQFVYTEFNETEKSRVVKRWGRVYLKDLDVDLEAELQLEYTKLRDNVEAAVASGAFPSWAAEPPNRHIALFVYPNKKRAEKKDSAWIARIATSSFEAPLPTIPEIEILKPPAGMDVTRPTDEEDAIYDEYIGRHEAATKLELPQDERDFIAKEMAAKYEMQPSAIGKIAEKVAIARMYGF